MSRFCAEKVVGPILAATEHWKTRCLLADGSLFTDEQLWTLENAEALNRYFVNQLDEGTGSFLDKLEGQLAPTEPAVKKLAAEMTWVMMLCPGNIGISKKIEGIAQIWGWSGEQLDLGSRWLQDDVLSGVGSAGTSYNTNRWRELVFFIRVLMRFKQLKEEERNALFNDGWALAGWLEQVEECNKRQLRHMLLFLLFPDDFERIFGGVDRKQIIQAFTRKPKSQVRILSALEKDRLLAQIRSEKEAEHGTKELDFYIPPLKEVWKDTEVQSWLFAWNPGHWDWEDLPEQRHLTHEGKTFTARWSCANRNANVGDKAYLTRVGQSPKGIIAAGNIVTAPFEAPHWDEEKAAQGQRQWYVEIAFSRLQDPLQNDPIISEEDLAKITVDKQEWSPQSSGIEIKKHSAAVLEKLWQTIIGTGKSTSEETGVVNVDKPTNLVLYGPPGTGKTYYLNKLIADYTGQKQAISRDAWLIQQVMDARWFDVVFAALYELGTEAKVGKLVQHEYVQLKAKAQGRTKNLAQTMWATLQAHTIEESSTVQYRNRAAPQVFDKDSNSRWSLVEDWENECEEQLALAKAWKAGPTEEARHQRYEFITFHQAYSYEDFVEGLRPTHDEETGNVAYQVLPGVFRRICQRAKADPGKRYAVFIDEINRGNIARIFGELITLVEPDKRATYDASGQLRSGMELTLPYSGEKFGVPKNLDVYGAMNTADRSISLLDTALRRRFLFKELMPNEDLINGSRGDGYIEDGEGSVINLREVLEAINLRIKLLLNRDMTIGHAYFMEVRTFSQLQDVLVNQVIPLLQEYFHEDWRRIQLVLGDVDPDGGPVEPQIIRHELLDSNSVLGMEFDDFEDMIEYSVAPTEEITPDSVRKIYEERE